jgi:F0F1-type ATP synthase assembly protein I
MSSSADGSPPDADLDGPDGPAKRAARKEANDAWAATSLLISGVLVWGGAGYLVSLWLGSPLFTMVGLLVGTTAALYGIWFRYGRS